MSMFKIVFDHHVQQATAVQLTPEEEAAAIAQSNAIEAVEAPIRAQAATDAAEKSAAKLSPVIQQLVIRTNAGIRQYVQDEVNADGVTNLVTAQAALKNIETLIGHLAVAVAVMARRDLR